MLCFSEIRSAQKSNFTLGLQVKALGVFFIVCRPDFFVRPGLNVLLYLRRRRVHCHVPSAQLCHWRAPRNLYDDAYAHPPSEELSTARCDACDIRCSFDLIQCDECAAWCHYACAKMTPKLATSIDKWYCGGCRRKDSALEITYVRGLVPEKHPCNRRQGSH